jgi:hypothetical protein
MFVFEFFHTLNGVLHHGRQNILWIVLLAADEKDAIRRVIIIINSDKLLHFASTGIFSHIPVLVLAGPLIFPTLLTSGWSLNICETVFVPFRFSRWEISDAVKWAPIGNLSR